MKQLYLTSLLAGSLLATGSLRAQLDPTPAIAGVQADINYLGQNFLAPLSNALAESLGQGWHSRAKTGGLGYVDLRLESSVMFIPSQWQEFSIDPDRLTELRLVDPNDRVAPTALGLNEAGPELEYRDQRLLGLSGSRFRSPAGYGINLVPMAAVQLGVGLPAGLQLQFRYLPSVEIPLLTGSQVEAFGLGLQYDLLKHIPGAKALPFSVGLAAYYSEFSFFQSLSQDANNQRLELSAQNYGAKLLVSKQLLFINFYGGLGLRQVASEVGILGRYEYIDPLNPLQPEGFIEDPVRYQSDEQEAALVGHLGLRFDFLRLVFAQVDYQWGPLNGLNMGLGLRTPL